jgi:hypothetical protein
MTDPGPRLRSLVIRAGAELAVIILGVTIALWADGWVATRNDRAVETARLLALSENVSQTLNTLRAELEQSDSAVVVLRRLATAKPDQWTGPRVNDALLRGFFYISAFRPELSVYDDLKNAGELSLLRDAALRRSLSALASQLEQLRLQQDDMVTVQQLNLDSYLIRRIDLRPILGRYLQVDGLSSLELSDLTFLNEPEFHNLVLFKLDLAEQMNAAFKRVERALITVEESISQIGS